MRFLATDEERAALEAAAIVRGVTLSEVIRDSLRAVGVVRGESRPIVRGESFGSSGVRRLA